MLRRLIGEDVQGHALWPDLDLPEARARHRVRPGLSGEDRRAEEPGGLLESFDLLVRPEVRRRGDRVEDRNGAGASEPRCAVEDCEGDRSDHERPCVRVDERNEEADGGAQGEQRAQCWKVARPEERPLDAAGECHAGGGGQRAPSRRNPDLADHARGPSPTQRQRHLDRGHQIAQPGAAIVALALHTDAVKGNLAKSARDFKSLGCTPLASKACR